MVGSLMYLTITRHDLMYVVGLIACFMEEPTILHQQTVNRVFRYSKGTTELGILYKREGDEILLAYPNSVYAGDPDGCKSTSGYIFKLSSAVVAWSSKKQPIVTLSTIEAEFIAAAACVC
ncbi:secreted RxLR effector protein 161-like [Gossypium hirsutum]|uniref:Secreted RxLR effector protein 161-like n=1 Tax=Gossypium hirsutum TaxID=3635 RepID=A0ABM2ZBI2_GOSHI|nr:secreted RxLR effector protein 161-like [Gossypium hirsutum]